MARDRLPFAPEPSAASSHLPAGASNPRWRRFDRFVVFVILAGLCLPWLLLLGGRRPTPIENRPLVAFPQLTVTGLLDGSAMRGIDAFLADNIAVRSYAVRLRAEAIVLSGGTGNPQVIRGLGDWLFTRAEFETMCVDPVSTLSEPLERAATALTAAGRTFRFVTVPDKGAIYPDEIRPDNPFPPSCAAIQRPALRAGLARLGPMAIDGWTVLDSARADHPDELLYYHGDTHWTPLGALMVVRSLVQSFDPALWRDADVIVGAAFRHTDDLASQIGQRRVEHIPSVVVRPSATVARVDVAVPVAIHNARTIFRTEASGVTPTVAGRTLVVYDSFFFEDVGLVAPFFASATWVHISDLQAHPELATLLGPFDNVIVERVERGLYGTDLTALLGPLEQSAR